MTTEAEKPHAFANRKEVRQEILTMAEPAKKTDETTPPAPKNLILKLADIVRTIGHVDKSGRNEYQKYNYVKAADVAWIVRKALSERNIYLVCDVLEVRNYEIPAKEGVMQAVDVKMQFSFFDGDAPETVPIVLHSCGTGTDKGDKAIFKAQTGALKYGLRHAFLIPDESDPEGDESTDKAVAASKGVANAKIAAAKAGKDINSVKTPANAPDVLFYTYPERHNGHYAEFVNLKEFGSGLNEVAQEGLRLTIKKYAKSTNGVVLISADKMPSLIDELSDCKVPLKELGAA